MENKMKKYEEKIKFFLEQRENNGYENDKIKQNYSKISKIEEELDRNNKSKESLLKNREQAENEIKNNGAGKEEALKDVLMLDAELEKIENNLEENKKIKNTLEANINEEKQNNKIEIEEIKKAFNEISKLEEEIEKINRFKESLLKNREQAENEIKNNGAGKEEALKDILMLDAELKSLEKSLEKNKNQKKLLEEKIEEFVKKYDIDKKIENEEKINDNKIENNEEKQIKSIIQNNQKDILKYMKLLDKYKDNPEKCQSLKKAIYDLQDENKKLAESLEKNDKQQNKAEIVEYNNEKQYLQSNILEQRNILGIEQKETLKIEQKRPSITFNITTGKYYYTDINNKVTEYDFYYKRSDKGDKLYDLVSKEQKKCIIKYAMSKGLTKKQAKMIDDKVYRILMEKDSSLYDQYLEAIKTNNKTDKWFDLTYDLRKKDKTIERNVGLKNIMAVTRKAVAQSKAGIATMYKDKSKAKIYSLLAALGIGVGITGANALLNSGDKGKETETTVTQKIEKNTELKDNNIKDNINDNVNEKNVELEELNEIHSGDYVKISEGALLYKNPIDSIRIMNGESANETVQVKPSSSQDRLYKITMEAYYSSDGSYVSVIEGENIEEELAKKGLEQNFLENEDTIKMYHTVSNGIAQWVSADDVEKYNLRVDKFGNRVEKTEEEKNVDNAYDNYMKEYSKNHEEQQEQK